MVIFLTIMTLTFYIIFTSFSVLIGAKRLDDIEAVKQSTVWSLRGMIAESVGYILNSLFNFTDRPKGYFLVSQFLAIVSTTLVAYGYLTRNLFWGRFANITFGLSMSGVFGAVNPYVMSILPPSLFGMTYLIYSIVNSIINTVFPKVFR
jgi:hypothetical protein